MSVWRYAWTIAPLLTIVALGTSIAMQAVLLSRDAAYAVRTSITVAPITRTVRDIPVEVSLGREDGLRATRVVSLDDITTIPKALLARRVSLLSQARTEAIEVAIRFALDLA